MIDSGDEFSTRYARMRPAPRVTIRESSLLDTAFDFFAPLMRPVELGESARWNRQYIRPIPSKDGAWRSKITLKSGRERYYYFEDGAWKGKVAKKVSKQ